MAKGARKSGNQANTPSTDTQAANKGPGVQVKKVTIDTLLVPHFNELPSDITKREVLVHEYQEGIPLADLQILMNQVKFSQSKLTESLNRLSAYRKLVSTLLTQKKQEIAALKREATEQSRSPFVPIETTPVSPEVSGDSPK